jgi:glucokinase
MILAGDIGGTSTRLAIFDGESGPLAVRAEERYASASYPGLLEIVRAFTAKSAFRSAPRASGSPVPFGTGVSKRPTCPG